MALYGIHNQYLPLNLSHILHNHNYMLIIHGLSVCFNYGLKKIKVGILNKKQSQCFA